MQTFGERLCLPLWPCPYPLLPQRSLVLENNKAFPDVGAYALLLAGRLNLCIVGCCFSSALNSWCNFLRVSPRPHCRLLTALPSAPPTLIHHFYILQSTSICNYFLYLLTVFPTRIHVPSKQGLCLSSIPTVFPTPGGVPGRGQVRHKGWLNESCG